MNSKINTLFDYIKQSCESDLERIINFVLSIISANQQSEDKPSCPYCNRTHVIKMATGQENNASCAMTANVHICIQLMQ